MRACCRPWGSTTRVLHSDASHCEEQFIIRGACKSAYDMVQSICSTRENLLPRWTDDGSVSATGWTPPTFMANSIIEYMLYGIEGVQLRISNIADISLQRMLKEVKTTCTVLMH